MRIMEEGGISDCAVIALSRATSKDSWREGKREVSDGGELTHVHEPLKRRLEPQPKGVGA